jgi:hypothetical protein
MLVSARRFVLAGLTSLALVGVVAPLAQAQVRRGGIVFGGGPILPPINTNPRINASPQFMTLNQYAYNTAVLGRAFSTIPPYALGYNPYPQSVNFGPNFGPNFGGYNPYLYNPYASGFGYGSSLSTGAYGVGGAYGGGAYGVGSGTLSTDPTGGAYTNPYVPYADPYGGALRGAADVITANGRYLNQVQDARLRMVQADMAKLDLRKRIFDEARYERNEFMRTNSPEAVRLAEKEAALNRARRDPPLTEIWSGKSLNDLYLQLAAQQAKGIRSPNNVPLDEETLKHVNLTSGAGGSTALLRKDVDKLQWPLPLMGKQFEKDRADFTRRLTLAINELKEYKAVPVGTRNNLSESLEGLKKTLNDNVGDMSPSQFIEAKRFLNSLEDAFKALQDPNAITNLEKRWVAQGKTVADLVKYMTDNGVRFAPAVRGDEEAYRTLHYAMVAYDAGMAQVAQK